MTWGTFKLTLLSYIYAQIGKSDIPGVTSIFDYVHFDTILYVSSTPSSAADSTSTQLTRPLTIRQHVSTLTAVANLPPSLGRCIRELLRELAGCFDFRSQSLYITQDTLASFLWRTWQFYFAVDRSSLTRAQRFSWDFKLKARSVDDTCWCFWYTSKYGAASHVLIGPKVSLSH